MEKKQQVQRILGVDPGTTIMGFALLEAHNGKLSSLELGVLQLHRFESHPQRLQRIFERLQGLIDFHRPAAMAIEAPFYGKNPQSMLKLGRAQGVAIAAAITKGLDVTEYSPKTIKQAITGNGNAQKAQVAAMLERLLGSPLEERYLDATDALAAAVCHHFQSSGPVKGIAPKKGWEAFLRENPDRLK